MKTKPTGTCTCEPAASGRCAPNESQFPGAIVSLVGEIFCGGVAVGAGAARAIIGPPQLAQNFPPEPGFPQREQTFAAASRASAAACFAKIASRLLRDPSAAALR